MKLRLAKPYKSIKSLQVLDELPNFTLITGINGSGKTQLLESISTSDIDILIDDEVIATSDIIFVKFGELNVAGNNTYSSALAHQACDNVWNEFSNWRAQFFSELSQVRAGDDSKGAFLQYIQRFRNINDPNRENIIRAIAETLDREPETELRKISKHHFWKHLFDPETATSDVNFFSQNFAKLFAEYQVTLLKQRIYKYFNEAGYEEAPSVNPIELDELEANKPWDFVNEVLTAARFDFKVLPPDFWDTSEFDYTIQLEKKSTGDKVAFEELSTGEQVLFALALVRYKAERQSKIFPKLILLDEPDAPLHPAMTENLIDVISKVFVAQYDTKVIMTTHAPASVALAPDESVYLLEVVVDTNNRGVALNASNKSDALQTLSSGFVAVTKDENQSRVNIEIASSAKPVIFVEGTSDSLIIQKAWALLERRALPFRVVDCGNDDQIYSKINAVSVDENNDKNILAIFDFDAAFNKLKGLSGSRNRTTVFSNIKGQESTGLYRKRVNGQKRITAMALPVPSHRVNYASQTLAHESKLTIELLFEDDVLRRNSNLTTITQIGDSQLNVFQGNKTTFSSKHISNFNKDDFKHFDSLIKAIKAHLQL